MKSSTIQVIEKNNSFILHDSSLNIITSSDNIETAFNEYVLSRDEYLKSMKDSGLDFVLSTKRPANSDRGFFIKRAFIITIFATFVVAIGGFSGGVFFKLGSELASQKVNDSFKKFDDLSEEEKLLIFKEKLEVLKPYYVELKKMAEE
ncbi:hypothetical protein BIY24_01680 [Halobacteriovorax marinus]|uniref:hypothetical protein n=1 Tax=Halobacteriovorax marinus TaxID=97084 RepID=UPI000BC33B0A|nr:hypothetical protein [Halobacteriovorax marinus]ATH06692.1 hypothetical protein BIY24_01680 [Halobacteriovorax marinus]